MRRLLAFLVIMMLALAACGGNNGGDTGGDTTLPTLAATDTSTVPTPFGGGQNGDLNDTSGEVQYDPVSRDATVAVIEGANFTPSARGTVVFETTPLPNATTFQMPPPGTMPAAVTEDPDAAELVFDTITLYRTGGPAGIPMTIVVNQDGSVTKDGQAYTATPDQITALDNMLDAMSFFTIPGAFMGPGGSADAYSYTITVKRGDSQRGINLEEGYIPNEMRQLIAAIVGLTTA